MDLSSLLETYGENTVIAAIGLGIGLFFGGFAQRSRFCLRSAVVEFWEGQCADKIAVWLFAFAAALIATQGAILAGWLDVSQARQLAARGSISGAVVGGALFGAGMILARGCSSRMLVLGACGNLRAVLSGLIFAVAAQASGSGMLAPLRQSVAGWWTIDGGSSRDLLTLLGLGHTGGFVVGLLWLGAAWLFARRARLSRWAVLGGLGVGLTIALAWLATYLVASHAFEVLPVKSLSFTGPSADLLMLVLTQPGKPLDFDTGLVPGVVLGSFVMAYLARELKLEGFKDGLSMRRYIVGAVLMGFGGMLAGGCAVGAGVSGSAIFALTAWITLIAMWLGAGLTHRLIDAPKHLTTSATELVTAPQTLP